MERDIAILLLRLGFIAVLYFFLFQLLIVLWRDLRQPVQALPARVVSAGPSLEVIEAGESGRMPGEALALPSISSLGRAEHNTVILADPAISAEHALISYRLGQWWLEDLSSTNGTRLNDARIDQPAVLRNGDVIGVGTVRLRVHV